MKAKAVLTILSWGSVIAMLWLFFLRIAPFDLINIIIFLVLFLGSVFASAVGSTSQNYRLPRN